MLHVASFVSFLQFFFSPHGSPWWAGAVWGNIVAIVPCGVLGAVWVKLKLFPLNIIQRRLNELHDKHDRLHDLQTVHAAQLATLHSRLDALHDKHDKLDAKLDALAGGSGPEPSKLGG